MVEVPGTTLCVEKGSDHMRATYVASGLAHFISSLIEDRPQNDVRIIDTSSTFIIQTSASKSAIIETARVNGLPQILPAILKRPTRTEQKQLDEGVPPERLHERYIPSGFPPSEIIDYEAEKERWQTTFKSPGALPDDQLAPDGRLPLWAHLCSHFGLGANMKRTYPLLVHIWFAHQGLWAVRLCELILDYFSDIGDHSASLEGYWIKEIKPHLNGAGFKRLNWHKDATRVKALALVSPSTIQGSNTATAGQRPTNTTLDLFWPEMYLAYAGWLTIALPYYWQRTTKSRKDVATYYPVPSDIGFLKLKTIMHLVRNDPDIRTLYRKGPKLPRAHTEVWNTLLFFKTARTVTLDGRSDEIVPDGFSALASCFYKDISTNVPLEENVFTVSLPQLSPNLPNAHDIVLLLIDTLSAIRCTVSMLTDFNHHLNDLTELVQTYFLAPTGKNWLSFGLAYGQYCFHHIGALRYPSTLKQTMWEQQLMNHPQSNYTDILKDPGFQAIAAAIHFATTGLLWRTQRPQNPQPSMFKIRYGLDRDLLENARDSAQFISALAEFLRIYAWDRERLRVNNVHNEHWPPEITDEHFYRIVDLVDQYGSELVARLLVTSGLLRR